MISSSWRSGNTDTSTEKEQVGVSSEGHKVGQALLCMPIKKTWTKLGDQCMCSFSFFEVHRSCTTSLKSCRWLEDKEESNFILNNQELCSSDQRPNLFSKFFTLLWDANKKNMVQLHPCHVLSAVKLEVSEKGWFVASWRLWVTDTVMGIWKDTITKETYLEPWYECCTPLARINEDSLETRQHLHYLPLEIINKKIWELLKRN